MLNHITTLCVRLVVALRTATDRFLTGLGARVAAGPQAGQGTVEYVGLILLMAGVMAVAVAGSSKFKELPGVISDELTKAIKSAGGK